MLELCTTNFNNLKTEIMTAREFLKSKGIEHDHDTTMSVYVQNAGSTINAIISLMEEYHKALRIHDITGHNKQVSVSAAKQYAEFCVRCDRQGLPLIDLHDYISLYYGTDLGVGAVLPE